MCERVPRTNAVAARVIASALSGRGGFDAILAGTRAPVPTAAGAAAGLTVKSRERKSGYTRDRFGQSSGDTERNGGDTRIICKAMWKLYSKSPDRLEGHRRTQ